MSMSPELRTPFIRSLMCMALAAAVCGVGGISCTHKPPPKAEPRYQTLPLKQVPEFMKGTLFERVDVLATQAAPVSAYGLVGRLRNTGDSTAPTSVREWMLGQMVKRGFGQAHRGLGDFRPEAMLEGLMLLQKSLDKERRPLSWVVGEQGIYKANLPSQRETKRAQRIIATTLPSPDEI